MRIERIWSMPSRWTFTVKPIAELIDEEMRGLSPLIDPLAGKHSPAHVKNDLNPTFKTEFHMDALEFLLAQPTGHFAGGFYDPPYSFRQASECYKKFGREHLTATVTNMKYWSDVKDQLARVICPGGKVICCGWDSGGLGIDRRFEMTRLLLVPHGAGINDTLVTVEVREGLLSDKFKSPLKRVFG